MHQGDRRAPRLRRWLAGGQAVVDYLLRPGLRAEFGGPFNDQRQRAALFRELVRAGEIRAIVETGTYRGTTTEHMARLSGVPVYTVERDPRSGVYARLRLRALPRVHVEIGDSRRLLRRLAADPEVPRSNVLFYLDAHRPSELPLLDELAIIAAGWEQPFILVDDFEVPGDPGYGFNDDGPGRRLCVDLVRPVVGNDFMFFFPRSPSSEETGHRRGCALLVRRGPWADRMRGLGSLRSHDG